MQYGFAIDHRKCIGCHACTVACKSENDVPVGSFRTWVKYTEIGTFPQVRRHFAVLRCNHCTNAPCVTICPVNALDKRNDGIVDLDKDACIGCKACMQACPYDAIYLNEDTGGAEKCHFCAHRIEQGLQPACAVVCPEEAIIAGDLHDPQSKIAQLAALDGTLVRRPEQGTGPNVVYVGADPVSLRPGAAADPPMWLWSERRLAAPDWPPDRPIAPHATTTLNVDHDVHWGAEVSAYLVTKGIAAGAAILAPLAATFGLPPALAAWLPESVALAFTLITVALLVGDLARPWYFLRLLTRPNTKSWLVRGGWVLSAFGAVTTAILVARALGLDRVADGLRIPNTALGVLTAIYTAWLFAQCEGRDLWQNTRRLLPHLFAQALLLGAALFLPFVAAGRSTTILVVLFAAAAVAHFLFGLLEARGEHDTDNARQAASLLQRIPIAPGGTLMAFRTGLTMTNVAAVLVVVAALLGAASAPLTAFAAGLVVAGLFLYEQAFVRAGQLPPLS